ncbi:hypothetical protein NIES4071_01160 [Calothrix sp. NIES-4071]|nr:hypothetical protein NIES4071_01160 [Calothrix sp. NIES-4071]BAZ54462.1 hypothetical protein NIES4105_01150 [Calothrix sp. NIES-4105]
MKLKLIALATVISAMPTLVPALTHKASATCINVAVDNQIAIRDRNQPATQRRNTNQSISSDCFGNTSTATGTQVYTGGGKVNQTINRTQHLSGGKNPTGVRMPHININVGTKVNVPGPKR